LAQPGNRYKSVIEKITALYSVDISKPSPISLPNTNRTTLAGLFHILGYTYGAEIGVGGGMYTETLCQQIPGVKLYGIDAWKVYPGIVDFDSDAYLETDMQSAIKLTSKYNVVLVRKMSMDAIGMFQDKGFDFVYIDANHWDPYVTDDIVAWSKKVRRGGIVAGHDYHAEHPDVIKAVKEHATKPFFVVGETLLANYPENIPSWFWVVP